MIEVEQHLFDPGPPVPKPPPNPTTRIKVTVETEVMFDIERFFTEQLDEYLQYEQSSAGYDWWEKPMNFIWKYLEENSIGTMYWSAEGDVVEGFSDFDADMPSWSEQKTIDLHAYLKINQEGTERVRPGFN